MKLCPICATSYPADHRTCPTHGTVLVDTAELAPGTIVRDCYRIERTLGKGGMGTVYLAEHTLMKEPRALKFLSSALASNPTFVQRFLQEARAASKLRHPNIAATLELGQAEDGSFYISMEYVDGPSLRALILESPEGIAPTRTFSIIHGVADALGAAHAKRMVHRDIKPENILLAAIPEVEVPKVVDFGIVALNDSASLTQTGRPLLTAEYAAPEQWRGATPSSELDGRTDLYSLGCMFFEMLTGHLPFHADSYEGWFEQHVYSLPPSPSYIRPELARFAGLDALVLQLLAKDREQRPANVEAFLHDLNCVVAQGSGTRNLHREPTRNDLFVTDAKRKTMLDVQTGRPLPDSGWPSNTPPPPNNDFQPHNAPAYLNNSANPYQPLHPNPAIPAYSAPAYSAPIHVAPVSRVAPQATPSPLNRGVLFAILGTFLLLTLGVVAAFLWIRNKQNLQATQTEQTGQTGQMGQIDQSSQQHSLDVQPPPVNSGTAAIPSPATTPLQPSNPNGASRAQPSTKTPAMPTDPISIAAKAIALYNEKDYVAAGALLTKACTSGQADSCDYLGLMYQHKLGVSQDYGRAEAFYDKGCQAGSMAACSHLGNLYLNHLGVNQDYERALALYTRACNGDYADACQSLGSMYQFKKGVAQDFTRAVSLYGKACNNGSMNGCNSLGVLYQHSLGVQTDFAKSVALYGKACEAGVADGCNNLGYMHQHAMGLDQDYAKAAALYGKACQGGNAFACNNLGIMYQSKQGVEQDYARAATYYAKACEGGSSNGCSDLGDLYRTGNGVAKDSGKARTYLSKGCSMGNQWGCDRLKQVD
jgi:serine/threonine protein kinase/TPR repeat protein